MRHTCQIRGRTSCPPCMQIDVDLWDAINRYATAVGGHPLITPEQGNNTARKCAVADVAATLGRAITDGRSEIEKQLRSDHACLTRLYAESRDYVSTLTRERDDLVTSANQDVVERNQLDPICEVAMDIARVWKFERRAPSELLDQLEALLRGVAP